MNLKTTKTNTLYQPLGDKQFEYELRWMSIGKCLAESVQRFSVTYDKKTFVKLKHMNKLEKLGLGNSFSKHSKKWYNARQSPKQIQKDSNIRADKLLEMFSSHVACKISSVHEIEHNSET